MTTYESIDDVPIVRHEIAVTARHDPIPPWYVLVGRVATFILITTGLLILLYYVRFGNNIAATANATADRVEANSGRIEEILKLNQQTLKINACMDSLEEITANLRGQIQVLLVRQHANFANTELVKQIEAEALQLADQLEAGNKAIASAGLEAGQGNVPTICTNG